MSSIKIVEVNAKNFLSYKELKYIVPNKGIVMIEGVNTDSREYSDSNGAGKSTLFDAIYWALFEKWTRRSQYRAGRVVNDAVGKDCSVAVGLDLMALRMVLLGIARIPTTETICSYMLRVMRAKSTT